MTRLVTVKNRLKIQDHWKKMNFKMSYLLIIVGICFSLNSIYADDIEKQVRDISHKLRCPTCQAMSVKESDAGLSLNMKQRIRELLKDGKTEAEILQFFEERYGEWILRSPKKEGFNLVLWLLPGLIILIAVILLILSILKRSRQATTNELSPLSEKEQRKIDKDLDQI